MVNWNLITEQNMWWKYSDFWTYDKDLAKIHYVKNDEHKFKSISRKSMSKEFESDSIYLLKGPRRVGKTTWIKEQIYTLVKNEGINPKAIMYLSTQGIIKSAVDMAKAVRAFLDKNITEKRKFIFIDEVTDCGEPEEWASSIQNLSDSGLLKDTTILLTGSDPYLLERGAMKLAGRGIMRLFIRPLIFRDFLSTTLQTEFYHELLISSFPQLFTEETISKLKSDLTKNAINPDKEFSQITKALKKSDLVYHERELKFLFNLYLLSGGFPESIHSLLTSNNIKERIYSDILDSILEKLISVDKNPNTAESILKTWITNVLSITGKVERQGEMLSYNSIATDLGISQHVVESYIEWMDELMILNLTENYAGKIRDKKTLFKKMHIADPFLFQSIYSFFSEKSAFVACKELLEAEKNTGRIVEGIVATALRASREAPMLKSDSFLFFYNESGKEIDFILLNERSEVFGFEVKYREKAERMIMDKKELNHYFMITKNETDFTGDMKKIPAHIFFALLEKTNVHI
jgi:predicted AAA+ superfamily ATPase